MPLYDTRPVHLPVTDRVSHQILTLPISASMTVEDARDSARALKESARL
jgi:dTDP-4-amino-4,6-dideoxygalactose transaminase